MERLSQPIPTEIPMTVILLKDSDMERMVFILIQTKELKKQKTLTVVLGQKIKSMELASRYILILESIMDTGLAVKGMEKEL